MRSCPKSFVRCVSVTNQPVPPSRTSKRASSLRYAPSSPRLSRSGSGAFAFVAFDLALALGLDVSGLTESVCRTWPVLREAGSGVAAKLRKIGQRA